MSPAQDDPMIGSVLGGDRYRLLAILGKGGMGSVFRARDTVSQTDVALKTLHRRLAGEAHHLARFRREAEVTSALSHPNIVAVLDHGVEADGTPWLVMEVLAGESLSRLAAREAPLDVGRVVRIGRQLAYALGAVHNIGVVHRDLKPGNVMITDREGTEAIKVVDFGIARFFGSGTYEKLTATGQVIGTPNYMAPEQAYGGVIDAQTDIFAVGAILCVLLTGNPPYGRGDFYEVLTRLLGHDRRSLGETHPHLGPITDVVEGCLAFDPVQRYLSMAQLDAALAKLDPSPVTTLVRWSPTVPLHSLKLAPDPILDAVADVAQTAFLRAARGPSSEAGTPASPGPSPTAAGVPATATTSPAVSAPSPVALTSGRDLSSARTGRLIWAAAVGGLVVSLLAAAVIGVSLYFGVQRRPVAVTEAGAPVEVTALAPAIAPTQLNYPATPQVPAAARAMPALGDSSPESADEVVHSGRDHAPSPREPSPPAGMRPSMARPSDPGPRSMGTSGSASRGGPGRTSGQGPVSRAGPRMTYELTDAGPWGAATVRAALAPGIRRGNTCIAPLSDSFEDPVIWQLVVTFEEDGGIGMISTSSRGAWSTRVVSRCITSVIDGVHLPPSAVDRSRRKIEIRVRVVH